MSSVPSIRMLLMVLVVGAACHHAPSPDVVPMVASRPSTDDGGARARMNAARRDSIARADAASRNAAARADADRAREAAARSTIGAQLYFDFDKVELLPADITALDAKLPVLRAHSGVHIRIEGNTDDRGTDAYNMALGQRRAATAKRYLVANGIDTARVATVSYGEERPVCHEDNESCWHQNRRDDFAISAGAETLGSASH